MKTSKFKVKIVCGLRKDQEYTIDANEAHKAYYLLNNPDKRGTFDNGLGIVGSEIKRIVPDWNGTMGWNETYQLTSDDWREIHRSGIEEKMKSILYKAGAIGRRGEVDDMRTPLIDLVQGKYLELR